MNSHGRGSISTDLIIHHARVWSGNGAEAVAVKSGRIAAIGGNEQVLALAGAGTEVIDAIDRPLLPGFIDAHVHLLGCAETFFGVDCSPLYATSIAALQALIRQQASETPPGKWIKAFGYHQFFLDEGRHPTRWDLDAAAPSRPVRLLHQNRHICVLNSLGLQAAGITRRSPSPPGGVIEKDMLTGEPTGLLVGMYTWLSENIVPPLEADQVKEGIRLACQSFLSQGVTCIHDASARNGLSEWRLYGNLAKNGDLPLRLRLMVGVDQLEGVLRGGLSPQSGGSHLKLGAAKIVAEQIGDRLHPRPAELAGQVKKAHEAGFQVAIHAITPQAIKAAIEAIKALGDDESRQRRHRLEHCTYLSPALVRELAESGVIVVAQPSFLFYNGARYLVEVPLDRFSWLCRGKSLLRKGIRLVGSTDSPVVPNSVLTAVGTAVSRESQIGFVFGPRERVSVVEGMDLFTTAGAYAGFDEGEIGSIAIGKQADLVLLDKDPRAVPPTEIRNIHPETVVVGGRIAWRKGA